MPAKIIASTQDHLDIETIKNDLVVLKNGGVACILQTSSVNFDLLSEREQDAAIAAYSALLNSISFQLQILIRSKIMDITTYVENIKGLENKANSDPKTKSGLERYRKFIEDLVTKNQILDKKFYVVIPYFSVTLKPSSDPFFWLRSLLGFNTKRKERIDTENILIRAITELKPKRDHLIKEFSRINIKAEQMTTEQMVELFYDIYNPESARIQKVKESVEQYTTPLVEPKIIN